MTWLWLRGLVRRRAGRLAAVASGVAVSVALLASLGSFLAAAKATMTRQAVRSVSVDWQVGLAGGTDAGSALRTVRSEPGVRAALLVGYAASPGLDATTGGASRATAAARVLGLPAGYGTTFTGEIRLLSGTSTLPVSSSPGPPLALIAQQTASNLAVRVGDVVSVRRDGAGPFPVRVAGVVDLPQVDSLFQHIGAPPGSQASAPPDNVLILAEATWHRAFDAVGRSHPGLVSVQIHVALSHSLPSDPAAAFSRAVSAAHHLEARLAGGGIVGNNLGATLDAARNDALYAQVLFVFLGIPGALLAAALTITVAAAGDERRRREQSLLRLRGAHARQVMRLAAVEAGVVGAVGALVGVGAALVIGRVSFGTASFGTTTSSALGWMAASAGAGLLVAGVAVLGPARRALRDSVVAGRSAASRSARAQRRPAVLRIGVDAMLLAGATAVYAITSRSGYTLVLAPEGVPTISVSYWAFAGPIMFWGGVAILTWRVVDLVLRRGRRPIAWLVRPISGRLAGLAAAGASRHRRLLARASVLAGLALMFAFSTAVFNTTYKAQSAVDARLTNGADISVTNPPGTAIPNDEARRLAGVAGVRSVEPLMHRYAYIGADLQDLYGVRPTTITDATSLQDAYFTGASARTLIARLQTSPDSVLVSSETVRDYQLRLGDPIVLRLQDTTSQRLIPVTFHYAGIVKEFPTAPRDSFFVANAAYVARLSSDRSVGTFLLNAGGAVHSAAQGVRAVVGPGPAVRDITTTLTAVGSSLTAVDLAGLTRVELGFAVVLAVAGSALVLGLGLAERRRDLAIVAALGARPRQLRALLHVDTAVVGVSSLLAGTVGGAILAEILVKVLAGVFDPAPAGLSVPWTYVLGVAASSIVGSAAASRAVSARASHGVTSALRDL